MNNQPISNSQAKTNSSTMQQLFQNIWKIALPITIVSMLAMGIGAIAILNDAPMEQETIIELKPDGIKLENRIKKGQSE